VPNAPNAPNAASPVANAPLFIKSPAPTNSAPESPVASPEGSDLQKVLQEEVDRISGPPGSGKPFNPDGTTSLPEGAWNISGAYFFETLDELKEGDAVIFNADFINDLNKLFVRLNGGEADVTTVSPEHKSLIITALFNLIAIGIKYNLETNYANNDTFNAAIKKIVGDLKTAEKFKPDDESKSDLDKTINALSDFAGNKDAHTNAAGLVKSAKNASDQAGQTLTMLKATTLSPENISNTKTLIRSSIHDIDTANDALTMLDTNHPFAKIRQYIRQVLAYKAKAESYLTELERIETGKTINNASAAKTARQVRVSAIVGRPLNASVTKAVPNTSQLLGGGAGTGNASPTTPIENTSYPERNNKYLIQAHAALHAAEGEILKVTNSVEELEAFANTIEDKTNANTAEQLRLKNPINMAYNTTYGIILMSQNLIKRNQRLIDESILGISNSLRTAKTDEILNIQQRISQVMESMKMLIERFITIQGKFPKLLAFFGPIIQKLRTTTFGGGSSGGGSSASSGGGSAPAPGNTITRSRSSIPVTNAFGPETGGSSPSLIGSVRKQRGGKRVTKKAKKATKAKKAKATRRKTRR
jgi:hypothetical protein